MTEVASSLFSGKRSECNQVALMNASDCWTSPTLSSLHAANCIIAQVFNYWRYPNIILLLIHIQTLKNNKFTKTFLKYHSASWSSWYHCRNTLWSSCGRGPSAIEPIRRTDLRPLTLMLIWTRRWEWLACIHASRLCRRLSEHLGNIQRYTPITCYTTTQLYNIVIIFYTVLKQKWDIQHER